MIRDISLGLGCLAIFAVALMYVARVERGSSRRDRAQIARLQSDVRRLQQQLAFVEHSQLAAARVLMTTDVTEGLAAVDGIVMAAQQHPSTESIATRAISLLALTDDGRVNQALQRYAKSPALTVQVYAAKLLAGRGNGEPLAQTVTQLTADLNGADHQQRVRALLLLGHVAEPSSIGPIVALLRDTNSDIRSQAVAALGRFKDRSLVPSIEPLLADPVERVRSAATQAIEGAQ